MAVLRSVLRVRQAVATIGSCCLVLLAGCGGNVAHPDYRQVTGTVTLDGQPLSEGMVTLLPQPGEGSNTSTGPIDAQGRFRLSTHVKGDGVPPGTYHVVVIAWKVPPDMDDNGNSTPGVSLIPERYTNPQTSGLTITVTTEPSQTTDLHLKSK